MKFIHLIVGMTASLAIRANGAMAQEAQNIDALPPMFADAVAPDRATPHRQSTTHRAVTIDTATLATLGVGEWFAVRATPERVFAAKIVEVARRAEGKFSLLGTLDGIEESMFVIAVEQDAVAGTFQSPTTREHFKLKYTGEGGIHLMCSMDPSKFGGCATANSAPPIPPGAVWADPVPDDHDELGPLPIPPVSPDGDEPPFSGRGSCSAPQTILDGMVAYSDNVRVAMGGTNAVLAEIQAVQDVTNLVYSRSGIAARYRIVWTGEVAYAETADGSVDLDRLTDGGDGILDGLHSTRDAENADFCTLWLDNIGPDLCGIAWCDPGDTTDAFNVVVWDCAVDNFSHPHEIGHNQGCDHNDGDGSLGCGEYSYSLGHRFFAGSPLAGYRTVMAYDDDRSTYTRIGWFSTPNRTYLGVPVGSADHDNTRTINNTRAVCEAYQISRIDVWVDPGYVGLPFGTFSQPFASVASAVSVSREASSPLADAASLIIKPGTSTYTGTITKSMWIRACGGTVNIGGNP